MKTFKQFFPLGKYFGPYFKYDDITQQGKNNSEKKHGSYYEQHVVGYHGKMDYPIFEEKFIKRGFLI